ncbi:MAG: DsbA family protein [Candidatus Rokubacteria bacterium]|nr:DsbA family protein [Candidatus Rokubacteria bacterium]
MRLRQLQTELGDRLGIRWRAFPLRPTPDPSATFAGTYREEAWRRCRELSRDTSVTYRMWARPDFPSWSLPALEAAKCVALQGEALFEALHLKLYAAFFADGVNIGLPEEVTAVVRALPGLDVTRFLADYEAGKGRQAVLDDYEAAVREHGVRAIPTVVLEDGRRIVGAVSLAEYRRALGA